MDKRALALQLLAELGETLTVGAISLDEASQSCNLLFDEDLVLHIEFVEDTGRFVLSCYLGELPHENTESLLRELLAANLYWHRTRGATLGLEEGTGGVILCYAHSVSELDRSSFEALIKNFVNQAEKWSRGIAATPSADSDGKPALAATKRSHSPMIFG
jgi:Tir chaperone protein (CesT) family